MKNYHRRVFVLNFSDDDIPKFNSDQELKNFHEMIGRTVMYGLLNKCEEDTVALAIASIIDNGTEVDTAYYPRLTERDKWGDGSSRYLDSAGYILDDAIIKLRNKSEGRPFVIGAVNRGDYWSYHS